MMVSRGSGMEEIQRFMQSGRFSVSVAAMTGMVGRVGSGDVMLGMVRGTKLMGGTGRMRGPGDPGGE